jgi:outer membrane lipoprotein SlyB
MKKLTAVLLLAGTLSAGYAADYAPQEFDFSELGTVESIRQVPILELLPNVFEHAVRPQTIGELVIRTDDGRTVILHDEATQSFVAGQRVRLVASSHGQRVQHE